MFARQRSPVRRASADVAQVAFWTAVNVVLAVVFSLLLAFDDRVAHAVGL